MPSAPLSPDPARNIALGALAGLAIGIGIALLRQALDTRVRGVEDITAISPRPILGDIPLEKGRKDDPLGVESEPHGQYAESIRRLRTNLLFVDVTTGGHTFVVTSSVPGEGKTTTTINLALAIITEATLSFLGVGLPPTEPSLGTMIQVGNKYLFSGSWWMVAFPGLTLALLALAVNLLGDWLRDALNPKLR